MPLTDYERNIKLLNERIQWHEEERKKYLARLRRWFWTNVACASGGVVIGAILMYILYRCPS